MQFTLTDVHNNSEIYLQGGRSDYIKSSLENEDDYIWHDDHWGYIDHFSIIMTNSNLYEVMDWHGEEGYSKEYNITAEEVVILINKMCKGIPIEKIRRHTL
jgi:hypothetical protein